MLVMANAAESRSGRPAAHEDVPLLELRNISKTFPGVRALDDVSFPIFAGEIHMLCGEKTYTHPLGGRPQPDDSRAPRHALHAFELGFVHPITGQKYVFKSRWPKELAGWLARLRQQTG